MLQKYDKIKSSLLLAFAVAGGAAFSGAAAAQADACSLENGYSMDLSAYVVQASDCIDAAENFDSKIADELFIVLNSERVAEGRAPLNRRASLDKAAKAHALDMSVRIYADHVDHEGRDHLHRIRAFDRTMLVGASGANVTVSRSADDASSVHSKIKADAQNADNMMRDVFTDVGIGVIEQAGQYYVVQVFAAAEGEFETAIPVSATGSQPLRATFADRDRRVVAWGLMDAESGEMLARSKMPRVRFNAVRGTNLSNLDILVAAQDRTYVLKGPLVSGQ